eukprot:907750-Rhodomonas_salina.1
MPTLPYPTQRYPTLPYTTLLYPTLHYSTTMPTLPYPTQRYPTAVRKASLRPASLQYKSLQRVYWGVQGTARRGHTTSSEYAGTRSTRCSMR